LTVDWLIRIVVALEERERHLDRDGRCNCPAHPDRDKSLRVSRNGDGNVELTCDARCSFSDILCSLGLSANDVPVSETFALTETSPSLATPPPTPTPPPSPPNRTEKRGEQGAKEGESGPELYALLRRHKEERLEPIPIKLGEPTEPLTDVEQAAAEFIALAIGLRAAVDETRSLMCSCSLVRRQLGLDHDMQASRAIKGLVAKGVILPDGKMPGTQTRLYVPPTPIERQLAALGVPGYVASANRVEFDAVVKVGTELIGLDPLVEAGDEVAVSGADLIAVAPASAVGVVTTGDSTRDSDAFGSVHANENTGGSGHPPDGWRELLAEYREGTLA
jgi:hypothetical protein